MGAMLTNNYPLPSNSLHPSHLNAATTLPFSLLPLHTHVIPMEALISLPSSRSFHLSALPSKPPHPLPSLPFHHHHSIKTHHRIFSPTKTTRLNAQLSSSPATTITDLPGAEARTGGEKFNWFAHWYPLAPVCDLDKRAPNAKTVMGLDVVIWWDRHEGRWQVFDDRCPHRLAPLSEGRVDPWGRLQCVYHGWCFDGNGSCKYIPQAPPNGPPVHTFNKACAAVYPSVEQNKIVWFWPSTDPEYEDILMKQKPPYIPELDDASYTSTMGTRDLPYGYEVLIENLMDPAHVRYAHRGIMRIPKREVPGRYADREGGMPMEITIETLNITGFLAKQELGYGKFVAPCVFYVMPGWSSEDGSVSSLNIQEVSSTKSQQKQRRSLLIFMCIPVSPGRSRVIWVFPRNFSVWIDQIVPRWMFHVGQNLILDSDLYLLHVEERKIAKVGPSNWQKSCFVPTKSDAMVVAFRNWLRKYSNNQVDWGTLPTAYLPPTPPKEQLMDRYWSHVVQCSSCRVALKGLRTLEVFLQVISIASIGIVAAAKQGLMSTITRTAVVSAAVLCFLASRWLSHLIYKNFYFHDYSHAFR
ncbi:protochlorophyllide-dependent translocon component 52, chloroplastic-like isoform X2 [Phoenix dactylifera]|uniref:Protochlorophyllide-dependent translocon component 52, chloroplastic-like isoform X2 n=1 Tax=Phoenix dactylifera TaxID=42345 RepID=A0A8B8ZDE9_PHODC|nr:protochlorophyllide-dependent translocon component 52, chloroplastic-like isoform X2 [Phoenix dactylifera]